MHISLVRFVKAAVLAAGMLAASFAQAQTTAVLENPQSGSFQSGISVISGWACNAVTQSVEVMIDGKLPRLVMARGTPRNDTATACGRTDTGAAVLINYNDYGAGTHTAQMYVGGTPVGSTVSFTVVVPKDAFTTGLSKEVTVPDFPETGKNTVLVWQQAQQNFAIKSVGTGTTTTGGSVAAFVGSYTCNFSGGGSGTIVIASAGSATIDVNAFGTLYTGSGSVVSSGAFTGSYSGSGITYTMTGTFSTEAGTGRKVGSGTYAGPGLGSTSWSCFQ